MRKTQKSETGIPSKFGWILLCFFLFLIIATFLLFLKTDNDKSREKLASATMLDFLKPINSKVLIAELHLEKIGKELFDINSLTAVSCYNLNQSSDLYFLESQTNDEGLIKGIKQLQQELTFDTNFVLYDFCKINNNYYLTFSNRNKPFKLSFVKEAKAGSGKETISITKIDSSGNIQTIDGIESGISKNFKELSFYFSCPRIVGATMNDVIVFCSGNEGPESTMGLISINFDSSEADYISYCIDPLEDLNNPFEETDHTYTCYGKGKRVYYEGSLNLNSSMF